MATFLHRVRTVWSGGTGLPGYSSTYFAGITPVQSLIDAVRDCWTVMAGDLNTNVTATVEATVMELNVATGQFTSAQAGTARVVDFTGVGQVLPLQTQGILHYGTGFFVNGRELKGRWFIPGWTETDNTLGVPTSNAILKMINSGQTLLGLNVGWEAYSPTHHVSAPVITCSSPTHWGGLKSRRE